MKTREKLAACLGEHFHQSAYAGRTLDALEAIVQKAREEALEEAAQHLEGTHRHDGMNCSDRHSELAASGIVSVDSFGSTCGNCIRADHIRALKKAKP